VTLDPTATTVKQRFAQRLRFSERAARRREPGDALCSLSPPPPLAYPESLSVYFRESVPLTCAIRHRGAPSTFRRQSREFNGAVHRLLFAAVNGRKPRGPKITLDGAKDTRLIVSLDHPDEAKTALIT